MLNDSTRFVTSSSGSAAAAGAFGKMTVKCQCDPKATDERLTSFTHQVRIPLVRLLPRLFCILLLHRRILPRQRPHNIQRSPVDHELCRRLRRRINSQDGRQCEWVGSRVTVQTRLVGSRDLVHTCRFLKGTVGVFLFPETGESGTPGSASGAVHRDLGVSERAKCAEPARCQYGPKRM